MAPSRSSPVHHDPLVRQAQRHAAVQEIARERVVRDALAELDPQEEDAHLTYGALLERLCAVLVAERLRVAIEE